MNRPRIGIFVPRLSRYGGMERFGWSLAGDLAGDYDVTCVCSRAEDIPEGVKILKIARPPLGLFGKALWFALRSEQIRRTQNFDCTIGLANTVQQDILRVSGGPTTTFWKLSSRAWPPGMSRTWKMLRRRMHPGHKLVRIIEKIQLKRSPVKVANSHLVRNWTIDAHPWLSPDDFHVIYNKPDLSQFTPSTFLQSIQARKQFGLNPEGRIIGLAGTNFMLKGVSQTLQAMARLPGDISLMVAGGRNPARFQSTARSLGVENRVRFLGRVKSMPAFYRACDAFVLPTLYDACSNAVLEALACGLPVVSTACNGSSVFLDPDLVVPDPLDIDALARAVLLALSRPRNSAFIWPPHLSCGLNPYRELIAGFIQEKNHVRHSRRD